MIEFLRQAKSMEVEHLIAACYTALPSVRTCLDVGAHVGFHTRAMAEIGSVERVVAVEANSKLLAKLSELADKNSKIYLIPHALGPQNVSTVTFRSSEEYPGRGGIKGLHIWSRIDPNIEFSDCSVNVVSLDAILKDQFDNALDFAKFDIEGSEVRLLMDSNRIWSQSPILVMENSVHGPGLAGVSAKAWLGFVQSRKWSLVDFDLNIVADALDLFKFNHVWLVPNSKLDLLLGACRKVYEEWNTSGCIE